MLVCGLKFYLFVQKWNTNTDLGCTLETPLRSDSMFWSIWNSPFLHYGLVSSLEIINIGNTGNQNHPDLEVRVVLVTCFSNIDI